MDPTGQGPGTVTDKDGTSPVSLTKDSRLGWCVVPLFDKGCVAQGMYILPIFKDDGKLVSNLSLYLKTMDTIGNCQTPVYSLSVSQHNA